MLNNMEKGDKLVCINSINGILGNPLFIKDRIYTILDIYEHEYTLDHILWANEYVSFSEDFINKNFKLSQI